MTPKSQNSTVRKGDMIVITERKVSDKVQPKVKRGNLYVIMDVGTLRSGSVSLLSHVRSDSGQQCRINAERFVWRKITQKQIDEAEKRLRADLQKQLEAAAEKKFKEDCKRSEQILREEFTWHDHVQITFVPLIIAQMAWFYAETCRTWCAEQRISEVKALSRAVIKIHSDYEAFILKNLERKYFDHLKAQTNEFMQVPMVAKYLTIAYFSISNAYHRQYPDVPYHECRVYATIARMMIDLYRKHNAKMNKLLRTKVGASESADNPLITDKLDSCMDAYLGNYVLTPTDDTKATQTVIWRELCNSEFQVTND